MKLDTLKAASLAVVLGIATAGSPGVAQESINVLGHRVHQSVSTGETAGTTGGDVTAEWRAANGDINWITADVVPIHDRLLREMTLDSGNVSLAFFLNRFVSPSVFDLLEPLDEYQAARPIEDFDDLSPGMREAMTYEGKLYGIPFRQATNALHYNEEILTRMGFDAPPATFDELLEMAKALHHTDDNGQEVFGLTNHSGDSPTFLMNMAVAFGKPVITTDYQLNADTPEFIAALTAIKDLIDHGGLVPDYVSSNLDKLINDMQNGRAAMTINPFGRAAVLNDQNLSRFPGKIKTIAVPPGADGVSPATTEVWYLVIPRNAPQKDKAWDLIRTLSSPEATVREALNGNGPVRPSAFADPRIADNDPAAAEHARAVADAVIAIPGFDQVARAQDILVAESDTAILGRQTPEEAARRAQEQIAPLLP